MPVDLRDLTAQGSDLDGQGSQTLAKSPDGGCLVAAACSRMTCSTVGGLRSS